MSNLRFISQSSNDGSIWEMLMRPDYCPVANEPCQATCALSDVRCKIRDTAPPQRNWQSLTDEEIHSISMLNKRHYARVIEAKLREKNTWPSLLFLIGLCLLLRHGLCSQRLRRQKIFISELLKNDLKRWIKKMVSDKELLQECYKQLSVLFNNDVPLIIKLKDRLENTDKSLWRKRNDKRREEIPIKSSWFGLYNLP